MAATVAVLYAAADAADGARLVHGLRGRLGEKAVRRDGAGTAAAVVVLIGPGLRGELDGTPLAMDLEAALARGTPLVPVAVDGEPPPADPDRPPTLALLESVDSVPVYDDTWKDAVADVVARLPVRLRIRDWVRRHKKVSTVTAALGFAALVLGILNTLGVFEETLPELGGLEVAEEAAVGITLDEYLLDLLGGDEPERVFPRIDRRDQGYVYDVTVDLQHPASGRYAIRWSMREEGQNRFLRPWVRLVGVRFASSDATGVHRVWVPCPPLDGVRYVVEFTLENEERVRRPLARARGPVGECRDAEG